MVPWAVRFAGVVGSSESAGTRDPGCSRLRQPEVEQLRAGLREHDVARLQIAMDDAVRDARRSSASAI